MANEVTRLNLKGENFIGIENKSIQQVVEDAFKKTFGLKTEVNMESKIAKSENNASEYGYEKEIDVKNTWVWVEGYKGTDKDMRCNNYQYEIGKPERIPCEEVKECQSGFHLCLTMHDVFKYYPVGKGNRYFKVRALVRLSDKNDYGTGGGLTWNNHNLVYHDIRNKLVAAEIEFLEELTVDEILSNTKAKNWADEYKKLAIEIGIDTAETKMRITELTDLGYSLPFASYLINNQKYDVAKAVGSQPDLSMDMKCLMILQG